MLPVTIDYNPAVSQTAGIGRLVREQVQALLDYDSHTPYRLFFARPSGNVLLPQASNLSVRTTPVPVEWQLRFWHRLHLPVPVEWLSGRFSLYHATDFVLPPTLPNARTIVTVHDLSFVRTPAAAAPSLKRFLDKVVPRSIQRATHVIADSAATKNDIIELYHCQPEKISVVLSSVSPRFQPVSETPAVRARYGIGDQPYLFSLGTVQPRKNYSRVVRALHSLGNSANDVHLVIAGGSGWLQDELYETIRTTGMQSRVHMIGFADDVDLPALYSGALATVVPSTYEGFGFPVLESMACGTPVITSDVSSLPEVAGEAALLVNPLDVEAIAHAIQRILTDSQLRDTLTAAGYRQAARFTPAMTAQQLVQTYQHVLQMPVSP